FLWNVPTINATQARVRVTASDAAGNKGTGTSANDFTIASPDFSLAGTPSAQTVAPGASTTFTINVQGLNGLTDPVALTAAISPANSNLTASFSPASATPGGSSTLTIAASGSATPGTFNVTVTGTSGQIIHTTTVTVNVVQPDFGLFFSPSTVTG